MMRPQPEKGGGGAPSLPHFLSILYTNGEENYSKKSGEKKIYIYIKRMKLQFGQERWRGCGRGRQARGTWEGMSILIANEQDGPTCRGGGEGGCR